MPPRIILAHSRNLFSYEQLQAVKPYIVMAKTGHVEATAVANAITCVSANSIRHVYHENGIMNFADLKLLDIKTVVMAALDNVFAHGPSGMIGMATVSCMAEDETLRQFAETCRAKKTLAIGVTILTTMSNEECLKRFGTSISKTVLRLGKIAKECGLDGITCGAHELQYLHAKGLFDETFVSVVPGNRPKWASYVQERGRVGTPEQISKWGATYTVVGRAATDHPNPIEALKNISEEMAAAAY